MSVKHQRIDIVNLQCPSGGEEVAHRTRAGSTVSTVVSDDLASIVRDLFRHEFKDILRSSADQRTTKSPVLWLMPVAIRKRLRTES